MQRSSINKVIVVGRIGNKPEGRYTPSGTSTARFSVATNESWMDSDNNRQEHTEWHDIEALGKNADFATQYLQKGQLVCVEGRLHTNAWTDKDGNNRKKTEIKCQSVTPLEWKNEKKSDNSNDSVKEPAIEGEEELPF